jgi:hypothetical protein
VSRNELALIVGLNAALSVALVLAAAWLLPASGQRFATVDIASIYRAKEGQITAQLLRRDASDTDRAAALRHHLPPDRAGHQERTVDVHAHRPFEHRQRHLVRVDELLLDRLFNPARRIVLPPLRSRLGG